MFSKRKKGQAIPEIAAAMIVLTIVGLFILDIACLALASTANDALVKSAARAAASATDQRGTGTASDARSAATNIVNHAKTSSIIQKFAVELITWDGRIVVGANKSAFGETVSPGKVCVVTSITVVPPAVLRGVGKVRLFSKSVEPIVSIAPR